MANLMGLRGLLYRKVEAKLAEKKVEREQLREVKTQATAEAKKAAFEAKKAAIIKQAKERAVSRAQMPQTIKKAALGMAKQLAPSARGFSRMGSLQAPPLVATAQRAAAERPTSFFETGRRWKEQEARARAVYWQYPLRPKKNERNPFT
jgi:hypothetical protein